MGQSWERLAGRSGGTIAGLATVTPATISPAVCISSKAATGYSAEYCATGACPIDTNWELVSTVNDASTGAKVTLRQGVKVRLPGGSTC